MSDDNRIQQAYDPTRIYENRPECTHVDPPEARKAAPPPPPPNLPDASFGPLPRPVRTDVSAVRRVAPEERPARSDIQMRLDAFRERARPVFSAEGKDVAVRIPFRMTVKPAWANDPRNAMDAWAVQEHVVERNEPELRQAASAAGLGAKEVDGLKEGRATPEQTRDVTQALIDAGRLPAASKDAPDLPMRIRKMMVDHGIGLDCASYSQQAFLASRGLPRSATGLSPNIANENLTNLSGKGFARVPLSAASAGDLLILSPVKRGEAGHTLIVYDRRDATPDEEAELRKHSGFTSGHITAYVLDSSYGSDGEFGKGGVMRQIWWRDEETRTWARKMEEVDPDGRKDGGKYDVSKPDPHTNAEQVYGPFYHSIEGVYRPRGEGR